MIHLEIAKLFDQAADILEYQAANPFRIRAYRRAAQEMERFTGDLKRVVAEGRVKELPGIGVDLAEKIREYAETGAVRSLEALKASVPAGILDLLVVPGLGPRTAKLLNDRLGIASLKELERAALAHRLRGLPGIQTKKEENILRGIGIARAGQERMLLGAAYDLAEELLGHLRSFPGVERAEPAGSLRRMRETIGDLDLLAASKTPKPVMGSLTKSAFAARVIASGETKTSLATPAGVQVDVRVVPPESFGAALQYFTGSKEHNVKLRELAVRKGLKVNEYGVFKGKSAKPIAGREEADVYSALGLSWMPPELREDQGEIEASLNGELPDLVEAGDLKGDFHIHTTWSDGRHSLEAMAAAGREKGYQYIAICDHSQSLRVANGMSLARIRRYMAEIRAHNSSHEGMRLLLGSEVDILAGGKMDYPDEILSELDFVIGSIHSGFRQSQSVLTQRLIKAMENPYVTLIAHPTGRRIGQREPYSIDFDAVFAAAKRTHTAIEINAQPERLDLNDRAAREAKRKGVMLAISTDSHSTRDMDNIRFGLGTARRAWLGKKDLLNCLTLPELRRWIAAKRNRFGKKT